MKKDILQLKIVLSILVIILIIFIISSFYVSFLDKDIFHDYKNTKTYSLKINYDKTGINAIDNKIERYITLKKSDFLQEAKQVKKDSKIKYDFILEGQTEVYKDIYFTHVVLYEFTGTDYIREDLSYIYDDNSNKFLNIEDFLNDKEDFNKLSLMSKHVLKNKKEKLDKDLLEKGTAPEEKNYKNFYFDKKGLNIIFIPYQISTNSDAEIKILIPWSRTNEIVKDEYKNYTKKEKETKIVPERRSLEKYKGKKLIAFTFDDGPNEETTSILLNNLDKYDAKVTFFVLGSRVSYNEEVLKRAYSEGNDIGSHTYSHRDLTVLKDSTIIEEIDKTNDEVYRVIGKYPIYLRPPYGSVTDHIKDLTIMHTICWNVDSLDWKLKNAKKIKKEIVKHAEDGDIVLVHDIYKESVYGALLAMKELKAKGYYFVTISEMAKLKNVTFDYDKTYYGF